MMLRLAFAALLAAAAIVMSVLGRQLLVPGAFLFCYPAVLLAALYAGLGPALLTAVLCALGVDLWLLPPVGALSLESADLFRVIAFLLLSSVVAYLTASERAARRGADARAEESARLARQLEEQASELEHQIGESQAMQLELEEQQVLLREAQEMTVLEARRLRFVGDASRILSSSLDYEATMQAVAEAFVPELSDWCAVDMLVDPDADEWPPRVERVAVAHENPARVKWARELEARMPTDWTAESGLPRVIRTGEPEFLPVVTEEMVLASARDEEELALLREIGFSGFICVPIRSERRVLGAVTLAMSDSGRHYTDSDLRLAEDVAERAAVAIRHAKLYEEAQRARAEAEHANRAKTEFLTVMSHELRTPLNAIGGYAQLIELGVRGEVNEQQQHDLQRIQRSARHLLSLINQILNFAKLDAGQVKLESRRVPMEEALADMEALVTPQLAAKHIAFERTTEDGDVVLWCDPEKLQQILLNLLSNAAKFTPEGGRVTVRSEAEGEFASIVVHDSGPGVPHEKLESIFEPFVQLDRGLTSTQEGAGLGLAISRELARAMGGDLRAEESDDGARFRLTLPTVLDRGPS